MEEINAKKGKPLQYGLNYREEEAVLENSSLNFGHKKYTKKGNDPGRVQITRS
jgi:hypothetical protein